MPRGTLFVDEKLLRDHFLRQQRGGNIAGYRGARMQRVMGSEVFSRVLRDMLSLYSNKVLKLLATVDNVDNHVNRVILNFKSIIRFIVVRFHFPFHTWVIRFQSQFHSIRFHLIYIIRIPGLFVTK